MPVRDRVQELRNSIAEMVVDFVPTADARRMLSDLDELVEMVRAARRAQPSGGWDGREFS